MGSRNPSATLHLVLDALARSGQRAVLASGWGGMVAPALPESARLVASVPHSWLFERMVVVHHGGAGTTAVGLRSGAPSIIVPFAAEQPFWGKRIADLDGGPKAIPRTKLTSERLCDAINDAIRNGPTRERAHALGQQVRVEESVGRAVALISDFAYRRQASHAVAH